MSLYDWEGVAKHHEAAAKALREERDALRARVEELEAFVRIAIKMPYDDVCGGCYWVCAKGAEVLKAADRD